MFTGSTCALEWAVKFVNEGERQLQQQKEIVEQILAKGHSATAEQRLLRVIEQLQGSNIAELQRIREEQRKAI